MSTDLELMQRIAARDEAAFDRLRQREAERLRAHLLPIVRDEGFAADLLQEVFLRVWTRPEAWHGRGSLRAWLYRVATNLALNCLRDSSRRPALHLPDGVSPDEDDEEPRAWVTSSIDDPAESIELAEQRRWLAQQLAALSGEHRAVLQLVHGQALSIRETARQLGIPEGTVKSRLHYATQRLARDWREATDETEDER